MKKTILAAILLLFSFSSFAACIKSVHVIGTAGNAAFCKSEYEFKLKKQNDALEAKKDAYEEKQAEARKPPPPKNVGAQSGNTGTFINLGGWAGDSSASKEESKSVNGVAQAKHNITAEWHAYRFPKMDELDRQMPDQWLIPRSFRYDWFFSKNFGFGLIYELYKLTNTRSFDPITSNQDIRETVEIINADGTTGTATREVNKDVPYLFPGAIKSVEYENLWYFVTINSSLGESSNWYGVIRFGSALISKATIEYHDVDLSLDENEYATQPENREVSAGMPMFFDFAVERWFESSRVSGYIRFTEANNDTTSRLDFVPMGGVTVGLSLTAGLTGLGYL